MDEIENSEPVSNSECGSETASSEAEGLKVINMDETENSGPVAASECGSDAEGSEMSDSSPEIPTSPVWTSEERALLLAAIKQYGMLNLDRLASILKTKNVKQIKQLFAKVSRAVSAERRQRALKNASKKLATYENNKHAKKLLAMKHKRKNNVTAPTNDPTQQFWNKLVLTEMGHGPLDWWLDLIWNMTKHEPKASAITMAFPRAMSIISKYEDHPDPSLCGGVSYKEAYDCLYHVMSGVPPPAMSPQTAQFIERSISRLFESLEDAMYSPQHSAYYGAQMNFLMSASASAGKKPPQQTYGANQKVYTRKGGNQQLTSSQAMTKLASKMIFNPLNVPESLTWKKEHVPDNVNPAENLKPPNTRVFTPAKTNSNSEEVTFGIFS